MTEIAGLFVDFSADKLKQLCSRIEDCLSRLNDEQVWMRGSDSSNAIGNLVLHLCGNVGQWIGTGIGGRPDTRHRDAEFAARGDISASELAERLNQTLSEALEIIRGLDDERLVEIVTIQNYRVSVLEAVFHVVEHFAQHSAQIVFATKLLTSQDLGYYKHLTGRQPVQNPTSKP